MADRDVPVQNSWVHKMSYEPERRENRKQDGDAVGDGEKLRDGLGAFLKFLLSRDGREIRNLKETVHVIDTYKNTILPLHIPASLEAGVNG